MSKIKVQVKMENKTSFSKKYLKNKLDQAIHQFEVCWALLSGLKFNQKQKDGALLDFQPTLAKALHDLDRLYESYCAEENRLITNKSNFKFEWFKRRMKTLNFYKEAVVNAISIGKSLGDAFAWIFYMNDPDKTVLHYQQSANKHSPSGIGGIGELALIKDHQVINPYFLLYHGITSYMGVGDFSLIDMETFKVAAICEAKSSKVAEGIVRVKLHVITSQDLSKAEIKFLEEIVNVNKIQESSNPKFNARLGRQLLRMETFVKGARPDFKGNMVGSYHTEEIDELANKLRKSYFATQKIGSGLLLYGIRVPQTKVSTRFLSPLSKDFLDKLDPNIQATITSLFTDKSAFNALNSGQFKFPEVIPRGFTPMFWWPVNHAFLHDLLFWRILMYSFYNPANFYSQIESVGYKLERNAATNDWSIILENEKGKFVFEGLSYFVSSIMNQLMKEEAAIAIIETFLKAVENENISLAKRIDLNIHHWVI